MSHRFFTWRFSLTWLAHVFKAVCKQHHAELRPVLSPLIPRDGVILDVGAHSGQFAKLFSKMAPAGQVFSVEPGTYARSILRLAIGFNGLKNVVILPMGLGSAIGPELLSVPIKKSGSFGFGLSHIGSGPGGVGERFAVALDPVSLVTLDALAQKLDLQRLDFIKVDIEGWELRMIEGGLDTIRRFKPVIFAEMTASHLGRAGDSLEAAWARMTGLGYSPHRLSEGTNKLEPMTAMADGDIWWLPVKG